MTLINSCKKMSKGRFLTLKNMKRYNSTKISLPYIQVTWHPLLLEECYLQATFVMWPTSLENLNFLLLNKIYFLTIYLLTPLPVKPPAVLDFFSLSSSSSLPSKLSWDWCHEMLLFGIQITKKGINLLPLLPFHGLMLH